MRRNVLVVLGLLCGLFLAAMPVMAHHTFAAQYNTTKTVSFKGMVTKVEWKNPHVYFYVDVKDEAGKVANWAIEGASATVLYRLGWRKDSLKVGDQVTVEAFLAKDGSNFANMSVVMLGDRKLFSRVEGSDDTK